MEQQLITPQQHYLLLDDSIADLAEMCERAGAATSTVICSSDRVVIFYKDPLTNSVQEADFVDELHIQHPKNARLLIVVYPMDDK